MLIYRKKKHMYSMLCSFMAIETLEFGYTVIMFVYYAGLYRTKTRKRF